jgi:hypothetical protein
MSKIVYLIEQPLDERNYERFGIQAWIDRGWDIEVWDLTPLSYPQLWQNYIESGGKLKSFDGYYCMASATELKHRYAEPEKIRYFIDLTGDHFYTIRVKMHLMKMGATRCIHSLGSIPTSIKRSDLKGKIGKLFKNSPVTSCKWLSEVLLRKLTATLIRPNLVVVSGNKSIQSIGCATELIKAHNFDYDTYLKIRNPVDVPVERYAVFIDQYLCSHPDTVPEGWLYPATPEKYFPSVCNALRKISDALGIAPCVAAHPRALYQHPDQNYFEGIAIKYGATGELIRDCSVVVTHYSTATQLAVLFGKPVIFITTDELDASECRTFIADFAMAFGKTVINIDRDLDKVDWEKELCVDMGKYASYRNEYIKTDGSSEKPIWDIVIDYMDKQESVRSTVSSAC